jgi:hypothetical protein
VIVHKLYKVNIDNHFVSWKNFDDYVDVCRVWKIVREKIIVGIKQPRLRRARTL